MEWFAISLCPQFAVKITSFPVIAGRGEGVDQPNFLLIDDPTVSRKQFSLVLRSGVVFLKNESHSNPPELDGAIVDTMVELTSDAAHIVRIGNVILGLGTSYTAVAEAVNRENTVRYNVCVNGQVIGPLTEAQLIDACQKGIINRHTKIYLASDQETCYEAHELIDFPDEPKSKQMMIGEGNPWRESKQTKPHVDVMQTRPHVDAKQATKGIKGVVWVVVISLLGVGIAGLVFALANYRKTVSTVLVQSDNETTNESSSTNKVDMNDFRTIQNKLVIIETSGGAGSGFLANMNGKIYLVSNEHLLRSEETPKATLLSGETLKLGEFSVATDRDLARFEVSESSAGFDIALAKPTMSDECGIYGNSGGHGVVTELHGKIIGVGPKFLETDAEFVPGNSGSPALDMTGKVFGVADITINDKVLSEYDWGIKDTKFDAVRRFLVCLDSRITWRPLDRLEYEVQVGRFNEFVSFFNGSVPEEY